MMSKLIIVCCIALLAPAICFNTARQQSETVLRAAKDECIRGIQSIYIRVLNTTVARTEANLTPKNIMAENTAKTDGNVYFHKIIGKVNDLATMTSVEKHEPIAGIAVHCTDAIMEEVEQGVMKFLNPLDTISVVRT